MRGAQRSQLAFSSNLSARPGSSPPELCVLGKLPALSVPRLTPQRQGGGGRDLSELLGEGAAAPRGVRPGGAGEALGERLRARGKG